MQLSKQIKQITKSMQDGKSMSKLLKETAAVQTLDGAEKWTLISGHELKQFKQ